MKSRRLVFPEKGRCVVEEVELAKDLGANELLLRNRVSLISAGTELALYAGTHRAIDVPENKWAKYPFRPGYAAVGEVLKTGSAVKGYKVGDLAVHGGSHADYLIVGVDPWGAEVALPAGCDREALVFYKMLKISITAVRLAPPVFGQNVVVIGMGVVGNLAAQLYKLAGAHKVAGADLSQARLDIAKKSGAIDLAFHVKDKPLKECVKELGEFGAEIIVEAVGSSLAIDAALKAVARKGRVVLLGSPRVKMEIDPYFDIHATGVQVIGAHGAAVDEQIRTRDKMFLFELLSGGKVRVKDLITQRMPFEKAQAAYEGLLKETDKYVGVILTYPG